MIRLNVKHVLIPTDFSETAGHALLHAMHIARKFDARLTLLHVHEVFAHEVVMTDVMQHELDINNAYDERAREQLAAWGDRAREAGIGQVDMVLTSGHIASEVARFVKEEQVDLVVMGTHGVKGVEEFFLGSNAYRVISLVKCPVLTVREESPVTDYRNVVVPMDETIFSRQKLPLCADWARAFESNLRLICLCDTLNESEMHKLDMVCGQVSTFLNAEKVTFSINHVEADNTAEEAVRFAEYSDADLLVIMSETETTIGGMLLGNYAQQVVNHSRVPVLTVHPEEGRDTGLDIFT